VEQNRIERFPPALQTGVHTMYTTIPICTGRETRTLKMLILNQPRMPFRHPCNCGSSKICTYSALKHLFYRQARLSHFGVLPFCLRNRTRTCNLLHPKQVNNQSLSSQSYNLGVFGNRTLFFGFTFRDFTK
jgi:hypothetical protein